MTQNPFSLDDTEFKEAKIKYRKELRERDPSLNSIAAARQSIEFFKNPTDEVFEWLLQRHYVVRLFGLPQGKIKEAKKMYEEELKKKMQDVPFSMKSLMSSSTAENFFCRETIRLKNWLIKRNFLEGPIEKEDPDIVFIPLEEFKTMTESMKELKAIIWRLKQQIYEEEEEEEEEEDTIDIEKATFQKYLSENLNTYMLNGLSEEDAKIEIAEEYKQLTDEDKEQYRPRK